MKMTQEREMKLNISLILFLAALSFVLITNEKEEYLLSLILFAIYNVLYRELDKTTCIIFSGFIFLQVGITGILTNDIIFGVFILIIAVIQFIGFFVKQLKKTKKLVLKSLNKFTN